MIFKRTFDNIMGKKQEQKFDNILDAVAKVVSEKGYGGAAMRMVAKEANISLAGMYYYFSSKDEMLFRIQYETFRSIVDTLKIKLKQAKTDKEKIRAIVENHVSHFTKDMNRLKVCVHELESLKGEYYQRVLDVRRDYFKLVKDTVESITNKDGYIASLLLFGMINWIYTWYRPRGRIKKEDLINQTVNIFLNGINGQKEEDHV